MSDPIQDLLYHPLELKSIKSANPEGGYTTGILSHKEYLHGHRENLLNSGHFSHIKETRIIIRAANDDADDETKYFHSPVLPDLTNKITSLEEQYPHFVSPS